MLLFPDAEHVRMAFDALMARGLIVREIGVSYGIHDGLSISIGSEQAMRGVVDILKALVKTA